MYRMLLLEAGKEYELIDSRVMDTPYEPREGMIWSFRDGPNSQRFKRYLVTQVEIIQEWGKTADAIAWVYVSTIPPK